MRAARYEAFWQLAENFLFERFLRTTLIVAGRRNDSKNVSFDPDIIFELFMLRLQIMVMQQINFPARPSLNRSKTFIWLPFAGGISAFAVILPKPMGTGHGVGGGYPDASHVNGCYAETLDRKTGSNFGSL